MTRPTLEVADIIRAAGDGFIERNRKHLAWPHLKVLQAIRNCRTAALGGHLDRCSKCGHQAISYNSCRNRHCPKCQTNARENWLEKRATDLLPVSYFHLVFTIPHELSPIALQNKKLIYDLLFRSAAETLQTVAADPKHLGASIGCLAVLHTWGQNLLHHPHIHCLIPAGGLSPDRSQWISAPKGFFLPVRVLSAVFRGKFVDGFGRLFEAGKLGFHGSLSGLTHRKMFRRFVRQLFRQKWVVYAKRPFGGPEHVLQYLARYTHRVAISNHRLISFEEGKVTFRWKDYAHGNKKRKMTLTSDEFLRRFLLHILPRGFVRIRSFGFLANRSRRNLMPLCHRLLTETDSVQSPAASGKAEPAAHFWSCPFCGGPMLICEKLSVQRIRLRSVDRNVLVDSS
jgi:predicted Zn-ribbon and HTH transcriptional regulator